jgi:6-phosphogluconolactonase
MRPFLAYLKYSALLALGFTSCESSKNPTKTTGENKLLFVGTYTQKLGHVDGKASGIYSCSVNSETGALKILDSAALINPSFLTVSADGNYLYSVSETGGSEKTPMGSLAAFKVSENGNLLKINEVSSLGVSPCHVSITRDGQFVLLANYSRGNIVSYKIEANGGLSAPICNIKHAGKNPWAHQIRQHPNGRHIFAVDKGADRIFIYEIDKTGMLKRLNETATATGAGPRHLDFSPIDSNLVALVCENSSVLTTYRFDEKTTALIPLDSASTLPPNFVGKNSGADIHFHPSGRFIYSSNRGHNSLAILETNAQGQLKSLGHTPVEGEIPRNFLVHKNLVLVANQNSSTVTVFQTDASGKLVFKGLKNAIPTPVCLELGN